MSTSAEINRYIAKMLRLATECVSLHKFSKFMTSLALSHSDSWYTCQSVVTYQRDYVSLINWLLGSLDFPLFTNELVQTPKNGTYNVYLWIWFPVTFTIY